MYIDDNCHLAWIHLIYKHIPRLAPPLLALKKKFENSRFKSAVDDPEVWTTELKDIGKQMDEIGLTPHM